MNTQILLFQCMLLLFLLFVAVVEGGATVLMFIFPNMIDTLANRTKHAVTFFIDSQCHYV